MSRDFEAHDEQWQALEAPFLEVDPELNIFCLANGLDLLKNETGSPGRTLEWFREGLERRIRMIADGGSPPRYSVSVGASRKRKGRRFEAWRDVKRDVSFDEIAGAFRELLADCVDRANEIPEDDLIPEDA